MNIKLFQVDAFASKAFEGNPAAVCLLEQGRLFHDQWMQAVASEMNLSETAFVQQQATGLYHLRWFTPKAEVKLCGHATLATAHILWTETDIDSQKTLQFNTLSGRLKVSHHNGRITMNFPVETVIPVNNVLLKQQISKILSDEYIKIYQTNEDLLVEVANETILNNIQPNLAQLATLPIRCLVVTSVAIEYDFVSRVFAPAYGINEDPVTGSTHCALAPFWAKKLSKTSLFARQRSVRGGNLWLTLNNERVDISGTAITVFKGELLAIETPT